MDFPFHGIPTVPPRKDMTHLVSERKRKKEKKKKERERERSKTHSRRGGRKKTKKIIFFPDFLLPGLPLPRHRRALLDFRDGQARPLGRRDLEVQQGGRQGEHARFEEVGGLGELNKKKLEKRRFFFCHPFSTLDDSDRKKKPEPKSSKPLSFPLFADTHLRGPDSRKRQDTGLVRGASGERMEERRRGSKRGKKKAPSSKTVFSHPHSRALLINNGGKKNSLSLVKQGCQALIAIETARLSNPPDPDSPYWD